MRLILAAAVAALPFAALPVAALADDAKEEAIEARQGYFIMLSTNMATLAGMAKGEIAYDEAQAASAAGNIELLSKYTLPIHFIEGTSMADMAGETAAKAEIWSNNADFAAKFGDFQTAAAGAGDAVKGGQANVGATVQKLGGTCKACHDTYRGKE